MVAGVTVAAVCAAGVKVGVMGAMVVESGVRVTAGRVGVRTRDVGEGVRPRISVCNAVAVIRSGCSVATAVAVGSFGGLITRLSSI